MKNQFVPLFSTIKSAKTIGSRKKLQLVYFILKSLGLHHGWEEYSNTYFGPLSPDVSLEIDALENEGLISESDGQIRFVKSPDDSEAESFNQLGKQIETVIIELVEQNEETLEFVSTVLYLNYRTPDLSMAVKKAKNLKSNFITDFSQGEKIINSLIAKYKSPKDANNKFQWSNSAL